MPVFTYFHNLNVKKKLLYTDKKETKFSLYIGKFRWDRGSKSYMRKGSWYMRKCTNMFTMRRSLVIYDFAPDPSEFPNIWGKFYFLFYQCKKSMRGTNRDSFSSVQPTIRPITNYPWLRRPSIQRPRPQKFRCNVSPSPTENSWMLHPLDKVSLGFFAPERTIPSEISDLIERSDTRLPTVARFSIAKRRSSMCGPSVHPIEGNQSNKPGQGRRRSRPDAPLIH